MKLILGLMCFGILGLFLTMGIYSAVNSDWWRAICFLGLYELIKVTVISVTVKEELSNFLLKILSNKAKKG
ncbi:MAG: hypothetical protein ACOCZ5_02010 [bacterium]